MVVSTAVFLSLLACLNQTELQVLLSFDQLIKISRGCFLLPKQRDFLAQQADMVQIVRVKQEIQRILQKMLKIISI